MGSMNWKPLPAFDGLPALFARPAFSSQSYSLHVTDLANIWVETLDRRGIGKRSLNEDTSIDPTEGADQMILLLTKIQAALDPSAPDHDQTSVSLGPLTGGPDGSLALAITCHLPDGLKPLQWTFRLTKCPAASIASELVLPLFQAQYTRCREVQHLITILKEKDNVIDKLADKLENAGVGLDNVFNTLSGKRKPSRELADEKVRGLARFSEASWRAENLPIADMPDGITSLLENAFSVPLHQQDLELSASDQLNDWWEKLASNTAVTAVQREKKKEDAKSPTNDQRGTQSEEPRLSADEDDDFQVQATPPHLASGRKGRTKVAERDTTDEEADAIPDSHPTPSLQARSRLGTINKGKSAEAPSAIHSSQRTPAAEEETASELDEEPVESPPRHRKVTILGTIGSKAGPAKGEAKPASPDPQVFRDDDNTASEVDEEPVKAVSPVPSHEEQQIPKRKLGAIGRIGGKQRQAVVPSESISKSPEAVPARPSGRKLGAIGKRKADVQRPEVVPSSQILAEIESEEQRAERKRVELAKELERKANAKPAKKKRKF